MFIGQGVAGASTGFLAGGPPQPAPAKVTHVAPRVHEKPILRPHHKWRPPNIRIRVFNDNENLNKHRRHHDQVVKREDVKRDDKRDDKRDEKPDDNKRDWFDELFEDALR